MRLRLAGLLKERLPSGAVRYRVRVEGDKTRRVPIPVGPDDPAFLDYYRAARAGVRIAPQADPLDLAAPRSVAWLSLLYEGHLDAQQASGQLAETTVRQRKAFMDKLRAEYGAKHMAMPQSAVVSLRDKLAGTPGTADNVVKAVRALYAWAVQRGHVEKNPAAGIRQINRGTGAVPWSIDDLDKYRRRHPLGTSAHLALTLFMFTSARLSDAYQLGPRHERMIGGVRHLHWQPGKRGSAPVTVPILPPLQRAIDAAQTGDTYLLNGWGRGFASRNAFGNWFRDRVSEAGLEDRSPHGIRKAGGELLALAGATQYHIMAIMGHTQAKTSEVYTQGVNRQRLATEAMQLMRDMDW